MQKKLGFYLKNPPRQLAAEDESSDLEQRWPAIDQQAEFALGAGRLKSAVSARCRDDAVPDGQRFKSAGFSV